jgi:hypothetical protein|tara:strand:- start:313 stop:570 length:258 start_codon:yes stop_codon:yes gene_type:complete
MATSSECSDDVVFNLEQATATLSRVNVELPSFDWWQCIQSRDGPRRNDLTCNIISEYRSDHLRCVIAETTGISDSNKAISHAAEL